MGRYRPPEKRGLKVITPQGKEALEQELKKLMHKQRPAVVKILAEAAAEGDRSENAEYIYRKKQLREMDRRIRYLIKRNEEVQVVNRLPDDQDVVYFGAWVTLEDEAGGLRTFRIVGTDERDPAKGFISIDAPLAQACLKKRCDDTVEVRAPEGVKMFWITEIRYEPLHGKAES
jgi:transcription elongation factor GreB